MSGDRENERLRGLIEAKAEKHRCRSGLWKAIVVGGGLTICGNVQAQQRWEVTLGGSAMVANNFNMPDYTRGAASVEATWLWRMESDEEWVRWRRGPSFGVRGSYARIPNGIAGDRLGVVGMLKAPMWGRIDYHLGLGLSYYTKPYCLTHDEENIFISSIVSCLIDVGVSVNVTERMFVQLSILHTSNGMLYRPNKGLNYFQVGAGYAIGKDGRRRVMERGESDGRWRGRQEMGFTISNGLVMSRHGMQDGYYPAYDLALNYERYVSPVVAVGGTVDLWYNYSHTWQLPRYKDRYGLPMYVNVMGCCEGFWGPLSIKAGVGGVVLASTRVGMRLYERVGAYYNWGNNYAGIGLNARAGMVEFIELSYGYRLPIGGR